MKINYLLKSDSFKSVLTELHSIKDYAADDYKRLVDEVVAFDPANGRDEEVIKVINNMLLSYRMEKLDFQELILLLFRLSSSFIHVF